MNFQGIVRRRPGHARTQQFGHARLDVAALVFILGATGKIGDLAFFRHGRGVARAVLLEEGLQVAVAGIDLLAQVVDRDHRIVELDLDVLLAIALANFLIANRDRSGNQRLQAPDQDVLLQAIFKFLHRHVEPIGDQPGILVVADELALGKESLANLAGVQILAHIVVGDADAELLGLRQQNLLLHQLLADALLEETQDHGVIRIVLLLRHLPGALADRLLADRFARREEAAVPVGVDHGIGVGGGGAHSGEAWNQVNHHGHRSGGDDDDEKCLGEAIVSLQETDHGWT